MKAGRMTDMLTISEERGWYQKINGAQKYQLLDLATDPIIWTLMCGLNRALRGMKYRTSCPPATNMVLDLWMLDGKNDGSLNPLSVSMNQPHSLQAVFNSSPLRTLIVTVTTVSGVPIQNLQVLVDSTSEITDSNGGIRVSIIQGNHNVMLEANLIAAGSQFTFLQWSDGNATNPREINVSGDLSLTLTEAPSNGTFPVLGGPALLSKATSSISTTTNSTNIPEFPIESIAAGILIGLVALMSLRYRSRIRQRASSKP
jgi:hypothetical protein